MIQFFKLLIFGEPAVVFGALSTGLMAALAFWEAAPLWFGIMAVTVNGLGTWFTRQNSSRNKPNG